MTRNEIRRLIQRTLSDWDISVVMTYPTEGETGYASFTLWGLKLEVPLHIYDGEIWVGHEDYGYKSPLTPETFWTWIASEFCTRSER